MDWGDYTTVIYHNLEAAKSKIKAPIDIAPGEASLPGLQMDALSSVLTWPERELSTLHLLVRALIPSW